MFITMTHTVVVQSQISGERLQLVSEVPQISTWPQTRNTPLKPVQSLHKQALKIIDEKLVVSITVNYLQIYLAELRKLY